MVGPAGLLGWIAFNVAVVALIVLDLAVANRTARRVGFREAIFWNVVWTAAGLAFALLILRLYGRSGAMEYLTGYLIERALSMDNIFVFVIIFQYFAVPEAYQRRVLYWGILGALAMRASLILAGVALVRLFHWVLYGFGVFLVYTGIALLVRKEEAPDPERNLAVRVARKLFPVDPTIRGQRFFVRREGRWHATPLLVVLIFLESTDLVFALDSIPAIFAVTRDPFLIYTSNVMAILGLRAMYFLLAAILPYFRFLKHGLSAVLVLIGTKMLAEPWFELGTAAALGLVAAILAASVIASVLFPAQASAEQARSGRFRAVLRKGG
jgi:tellurite resistance protein TerC